jgi:GntR family transcriptional regulator
MNELVKSPIPLYYQVAEILRADFLSKYEPGTRVPTEPELMERFGVSRTTIRRAIAILEETGVISRQSGKGTFLSEAKLQVELSELTGFVEDMVALGRQATAHVISKQTITPSPPIRDHLRLPPNVDVVLIERLRLADGEPISFDVTYLPEDLGAKIAQEDLEVHPIFSLMEGKYGVPLGEADYTIEASKAPRRVAGLLRIPPGSPVILIERTSYSTGGSPVDYEKLFYRADKIRYHMRLTRHRPVLMGPRRLRADLE